MTISDQSRILERSVSVNKSGADSQPPLALNNIKQSSFQSMLIKTIEHSQSSIAQQSRTRNSEAKYSTEAQPKLSAKASEASRVSAEKVSSPRMSPHTKSTEDASHHRSMVEHGGDQNLNAFGRQYLSQRLEIQERIINPTERIDVIQSSEGSSRLNVLETFDDQMNKNSLPSELAKSVTIQLQEERLLKEETAQTKIHYSDPTSVQDDHLASKGSTLNAADHSTTKVNSLSSEDPRDTPKSMVNVAIQSYVGTEQWGREVRQKIVWMFGIGQQSATLTLNPPNLGPLHVTLKMQNNIAHTTFRSNDPAVRQALAEGMVQLNEMMSQRGLILGKMSIHEINQEILKDEV